MTILDSRKPAEDSALENCQISLMGRFCFNRLKLHNSLQSEAKLCRSGDKKPKDILTHVKKDQADEKLDFVRYVFTNILDEIPETANISTVTGLIRRVLLSPVPSRMWRNWQTRRLQVPVGFGPWRFDSSHPH